jgi:hypothetical protein
LGEGECESLRETTLCLGVHKSLREATSLLFKPRLGLFGVAHSFVHGFSLLGSFLLIIVAYVFLIIVDSCALGLSMEMSGWRSSIAIWM